MRVPATRQDAKAQVREAEAAEEVDGLGPNIDGRGLAGKLPPEHAGGKPCVFRSDPPTASATLVWVSQEREAYERPPTRRSQIHDVLEEQRI